MFFNKLSIFSLILLLSFIISGCKEGENPVADYFKNAELQYEGKEQEENIITALNDILNLSEEELALKRYKDYSGEENEWDLPTLIYKHFVPDGEGKTLGDNFYHDIKSQEAQKEVKELLESLN